MAFKSVPTRARMRSAFAFLLGAAGLALCGWYGQAWLALPHYSPADIDRSAQLNLAVDLQRLPPKLQPDADQRSEMLRSERQEVVDDIAQQRKTTQAGFAAGLILLALSMGQFLLKQLTHRLQR